MTFDLVPRTLEEQVAWIDEHSGSHPAIVAVDGDDASSGSHRSRPYRPRPAYTPTVEDSVYVHRDHRGQGIGALLLGELVELGARPRLPLRRSAASSAATRRRSRCTETCGFDDVGVEREVGRKFGKWLDVVLMQLML